MTNQSSLQYLSALLNSPGSFTEGDHASMALYLETFPYFVPVRYLEALEKHRKSDFSPAMLSGIRPYLGNWISFCDFLEAGKADGSSIAASQAEEVTTLHYEAEKEEEMPVDFSAQEDTQPIERSYFESSDEKTEDSEMRMVEDANPELKVEIEETKEELMPDLIEEEAISFTDNLEEENKTDDENEVTTQNADDDEPLKIVSEVTEEGQLIMPVYTDDYFLQQGITLSEEPTDETKDDDEAKQKSLMVVMSFSEWLLHFRNTSERQEEEKQDQKALKTMWQKEKLAAALEEENEEIPENVFEMAVNSIIKEDGLASESLADIYIKQGKFDKAIEMYRKLSLRNPKKNAYFAHRIEEILKEKQS